MSNIMTDSKCKHYNWVHRITMHQINCRSYGTDSDVSFFKCLGCFEKNNLPLPIISRYRTRDLNKAIKLNNSSSNAKDVIKRIDNVLAAIKKFDAKHYELNTDLEQYSTSLLRGDYPQYLKQHNKEDNWSYMTENDAWYKVRKKLLKSKESLFRNSRIMDISFNYYKNLKKQFKEDPSEIVLL